MNYLALLLQSDNTDAQHALQAMMVAIPVFLGIVLVVLAIIIIPFWFICKKAGFSPWLSLLILIPLGNIVLIYVLAFAEWKVMPISQQGWPPQSYPRQPPNPTAPYSPSPPQG